jgi:hypothetical protein
MKQFSWATRAVVLLTLIVSFVKCSDNQVTEPIPNNQIPRVAHGPLNASNPYDSVGIHHNVRCEFLISYVGENDTTVSLGWASICEGMEDLADSLNWGQSYVNGILDSAQVGMNELDENYDPVEELQNCTSSQYITQKEAGYIQAIGNAFSAASDSASLISALQQIETDMNTETWGSEETTALSMISISKHSFSFWSGLILLLEEAIFIAAHDAIGYRKICNNGGSQEDAENTSHIFSSMAATVWFPGAPIIDI